MGTLAALIKGRQAWRGAEFDHAGITQIASKIPEKKDRDNTKEYAHKTSR